MAVSAISVLAVLGVASAAATLADLRWERRVLLVSAPQADDPAVAAQRRAFAGMARDSDDRDLVLVEALGEKVAGAADTAAGLRRRYRLPADRFTVILIGKDGGEKLRAVSAIPAAKLTATIDAMPMRRAGQR